MANPVAPVAGRNGGDHGRPEDLAAKELAHQVASTFAAGVMSSFQMSVASLDPTFKDAALNNLILVGWGAWKVAYAGVIAALKDPSWAAPGGVANQPQPVPPAPASLPALISAVVPTP